MSRCASWSKVKQKVVTEIMVAAHSSQGPAQGFEVPFLLPQAVVVSSRGPMGEAEGASHAVTKTAAVSSSPGLSGHLPPATRVTPLDRGSFHCAATTMCEQERWNQLQLAPTGQHHPSPWDTPTLPVLRPQQDHSIFLHSLYSHSHNILSVSCVLSKHEHSHNWTP